MFNSGYGNNGDFEALARQYWGAWGDAMRQAGMGAAAPAPAPPAGGWQQAMDWWSQLLPKAPSQANDALGRFNQQARDWYGHMQQVAAQFAGRDSNPSEVAQAWRQALGASGANPFPEMFKAMSGKGLHGLDDWIEQARPFLDSLQRDGEKWLSLPAFGQHRESQERLQALAQAQLDYQQRSQAFNVLMGTCAQRAFDVFESKLAAREEPGRQITSARGLFDLWIDAAEEAYSEIALSSEFRRLSGALTNAQMRLRAAIQKEVELIGAQFGMPTRTEVDSAHRKIAELERSLRRAAAAAERAAGAVGKPRAARSEASANVEEAPVAAAARPERRRRTAAKAATARQPAKRARRGVRKDAAKKTTPRKVAARKRAPAPATVEEKRVPAARTTRAKASSGKQKAAPKPPAARKAAARKTAATPQPAARKTAAAKSTPTTAKKRAAKKSTTATAASTRRGAGKQLPSMKDWVARNSPSAESRANTASVRSSTSKKGARK